MLFPDVERIWSVEQLLDAVGDCLVRLLYTVVHIVKII